MGRERPVRGILGLLDVVAGGKPRVEWLFAEQENAPKASAQRLGTARSTADDPIDHWSLVSVSLVPVRATKVGPKPEIMDPDFAGEKKP